MTEQEPTGKIVLRGDTPEWLESHYGPVARVTEKTLAKMHWAGTGPRVVKWGQRVGHFESDLHDWVRRRMALQRSSSDPGCSPPGQIAGRRS
jgi:hypothetical protein